jgi:putative transposase
MAIRTHIEATTGTFHITFTCFKWLSLFQMTEGYDIVYRQFDQLKFEGHSIVGYVIMPNHVYCIIHFSEAVKNINMRIER